MNGLYIITFKNVATSLEEGGIYYLMERTLANQLPITSVDLDSNLMDKFSIMMR